jgi:hypothetical protein
VCAEGFAEAPAFATGVGSLEPGIAALLAFAAESVAEEFAELFLSTATAPELPTAVFADGPAGAFEPGGISRTT